MWFHQSNTEYPRLVHHSGLTQEEKEAKWKVIFLVSHKVQVSWFNWAVNAGYYSKSKRKPRSAPSAKELKKNGMRELVNDHSLGVDSSSGYMESVGSQPLKRSHWWYPAQLSFSCSSLYLGYTSPDPQWMRQTAGSTKPHIHTMFFPIHTYLW